MKRILFAAPFVLHFFLCIFFSLDLDFLEGAYLGFPLTFLCLYFLFFPLALGLSSVAVFLFCRFRKKIDPLDAACAIAGVVLLAGYGISALGLAKGGLFSVVSVGIVAGVFVTVVLRVLQGIKKGRRKQK